ncbi:hypothetical protein BKP45_14065 [Anaerobacillus alkalidiazotrophicus]|uniref:Uncharacterized protein n=1 Tax=Anaerobacillus alkalidiazotrophicus TaxID=472963 RepID=A0A1S2M3U6_9BACI|nr:hypothetical protein [Anaerobacillus alkalidiazotrophicus]OIJ19276.1 hypothetical protein BKP45_14065 [Anaerobacillus alkalidiazotrophicus]
MELETFIKQVKHEKSLMVGDNNNSVEQLLVQNSKDCRRQIILVFYLLSDQKMMRSFFHASEYLLSLRRLRDQLHLALIRIKRNPNHGPEAIKIANLLLKRAFKKQSVCFHHSSNDIVLEMEHFLYRITNENENS